MGEPGRGRAPRTVLHVEQFGEGGAVASLLGLVQGLDPSRYRSVVAFRTPNASIDAFRAAGATVVVLDPGTGGGPVPPASAPDPAAADDGPRRADGSPLVWRSAWRREVGRIVRRDLPATRRLRAVIAEHRPDIVHAANEVGSNRYALLAASASRVPVVQHLRGLPNAEPGLATWVDRLLARRVGRAIAISRAVAAAVAEQLPALGDRLVVIDNPFDLAALPAPPGSGRAVAAELDLPAGAVPVVMLGRLAWWKGQDVLIRTTAQLASSRPEVVAVLVGSAATTYGAELERSLHALADELGVSDRVRFAGHRTDVPEVLDLASIVVHCSTQPEPFGRVVVEAMAAGRPVIASAAGGVLEIIEDGVTGILVPPGDPGALAGAIAAVLDDAELARSLASNAQAAVRARFSVDAHARAVEEVYDEVLGGR